MRWRYDATRLKWHERLVRYDKRWDAWMPWHWRVVGTTVSRPEPVRPWFGWGR